MMIGCDEGENIFAFGLIVIYFLFCMAFIAVEGNVADGNCVWNILAAL